LIEIFGEGAATGGREAVLGARDATFEKLYAGNVLRFFELAGVDAEVAVGGLEDTLEVVEAEGVVGRQGADDAETNAFVNQAIEFGKFVGAGVNFLMRLRGVFVAELSATLFANILTNVFVNPGLVLGVLAVR
jgi:hypothetical protein